MFKSHYEVNIYCASNINVKRWCIAKKQIHCFFNGYALCCRESHLCKYLFCVLHHFIYLIRMMSHSFTYNKKIANSIFMVVMYDKFTIFGKIYFTYFMKWNNYDVLCNFNIRSMFYSKRILEKHVLWIVS